MMVRRRRTSRAILAYTAPAMPSLTVKSGDYIHIDNSIMIHVTQKMQFIIYPLHICMLALVKEYIIDLWEVRKVKLYGEPCSTQPQSQSSAGDPRDGTVVGGQRRGKFGKFSHSGRVTGKLSTCITDDSCKTGSAYTGRVVNGRIARAAS